jgi:hypothetical protein
MTLNEITKLAKGYSYYLKLLDLRWFAPTFIVVGLMFYLIKGSIPYVSVLTIAILTNPTLPIGFMLFVRLWMPFDIVKRDLDLDSNRKQALLSIKAIEAQTDWSAKYFRQSVYVAYLLFGFSLRIRHSERHVNPTNSHMEDKVHRVLLMSSHYFQGIEAFVLSYLRGASDKAKDQALESALNALPLLVSKPSLRTMVMSTHKDGEGFLSTLSTLYDFFLCALLPSYLQDIILAIFSEHY